MDYHQHFDLDSGAGLTLNRAGHILGSATALVTIDAGSVLFSGDLAHKILAHTIRRTVTRGGPGRLSSWRPRQHQHGENYPLALSRTTLGIASKANYTFTVLNGVVVTRSQGEAGTRHE